LWLFDVESDPFERTNLAPAHPDIVARLLAKIQAWNDTRIPQSNSPTDPASNPGNFGGVWTPWVGDPVPAHCDPNATAAPPLHSSLDGLEVVVGPSTSTSSTSSTSGSGSGSAATLARISGWAWSVGDGQGGRAHLNVTLSANGAAVGAPVPCDIYRPRLVNDTGAPDGFHGFVLNITDPATLDRLVKGRVGITARTTVAGRGEQVGLEKCYSNGNAVEC